MSKHDLEVMTYLYRGHQINRFSSLWYVVDGDDILFQSDSIDECMAAIDRVCDDV